MQKYVQECIKETFHKEGQEPFQAMETRMETLENSVENMNKQVKRQSEAVEDLIDELQEKEAAVMEYKQRLQERQKREEALLLLICDWQKQLVMLEERICQEPMADAWKQEAWQKQFRLLKEQLAVKEKLCAIEETGTEGEHVDYRIHEVIRALETEQEDAVGTVAKVHSRGMVYEGKVIVKAEVEAYRKLS